MRKILFCAGLMIIFLSTGLNAQHLIGLDKETTKQMARKSGFYLDNLTVSQKFNYLKFVNSANTKTLIVFFSDDDVSTHTRTVCDYGEYDFVLKDMNTNYNKVSDNTWTYENDGQDYEVILEEKEWYFVLRTKKK